MKLGLSYVSYKDKLLGEQVAYVLDDMLTAVENGRSTIESKIGLIKRIKSSTKLSRKEMSSWKKKDILKSKRRKSVWKEKMSLNGLRRISPKRNKNRNKKNKRIY